MPALYAAVEGRHRGLPLFDSMYLLGRDAHARAGCAPLGIASDSAGDDGDPLSLIVDHSGVV